MEMRAKSKEMRKDFMQLLIEIKEKGSVTSEDENIESHDISEIIDNALMDEPISS
jgi:hypothetical protein